VTLNAFLTKFGKQINLNFLPQKKEIDEAEKNICEGKKARRSVTGKTRTKNDVIKHTQRRVAQRRCATMS
jgi:hypothetical protein